MYRNFLIPQYKIHTTKMTQFFIKTKIRAGQKSGVKIVLCEKKNSRQVEMINYPINN